VLTNSRTKRAEDRDITYLLRNIPGPLWIRAKHRAVDEGTSLRGLILAALRGYLAESKKKA